MVLAIRIVGVRLVFKRSLPLQYGLGNALLFASVVALTLGGWLIWLVLVAVYVIGGPIDETVDDSFGGPGTSARWFCDVNLFLTLPLITLLTIVFLRSLVSDDPVGIHGILGTSTDAFRLQSLDSRIDIAAAIFLVGSCYAMFGATVAHELTHRTGNSIAQLSARGLLALMFNTSFSIFHIHGHHRYVGTYRDPATARRGESIFAFTLRTMHGQLVDAYRHEAARLRLSGKSPFGWHNRFISGQFLSLATVVASAEIAGATGILGLLSAALIGRTLHEFVNYIQHFGLIRIEGAPVAARHTWDSYRTLSNALHYNLPRHSDHHMFAAKPYWELRSAPQAPVLPHGYLTMVLIALLPFAWQRVMAPRLADWDQRFANDDERAVVRQRGWENLC